MNVPANGEIKISGIIVIAINIPINETDPVLARIQNLRAVS